MDQIPLEPVVEIRTPGASRAADLASIVADLKRVIARCNLIAADTHSDDVNEALWESAVIAYGRCFSSGRATYGEAHQRRRITDEDLVVLDEVDLETHRLMRDERNKCVGHRDTGGEFVQALAFGEASNPQVASGVGLSVTARRGPNQKMRRLGDVARKLHHHLEAKLTEELGALQDERLAQTGLSSTQER